PEVGAVCGKATRTVLCGGRAMKHTSLPLQRRGLSWRISMKRLLTEIEKVEIIEREWAKARAKNPKDVMRPDVQDETDENGKPRVNVVIALHTQIKIDRRRSTPATCDEVIEKRREFITLLGGAAVT